MEDVSKQRDPIAGNLEMWRRSLDMEIPVVDEFRSISW